MTQIITCRTHDYIIQAADMRLSDLETNWRQEKAIKMVCFRNMAVFSFTGAALLGTTRTDEWMVDVLRDSVDFHSAIENLKTRATNYIRANPPNNKRLAFVAASFLPGPDRFFVPMLHVVSNWHDLGCVPLPDAQRPFSVQSCPLHASRSIDFHCIGRPLSQRTQDILWQNIKESGRKSGHPVGKPHYLSIASHLVNAIRRTAHEEPDGTVGEDVIAIVEPNRSIPALREDPSRLLYFARNSDDPEELVPHLVTRAGPFREIEVVNGIPDDLVAQIRRLQEEKAKTPS